MIGYTWFVKFFKIDDLNWQLISENEYKMSLNRGKMNISTAMKDVVSDFKIEIHLGNK